MTTLTPTRTKTASKSGKSKRITRCKDKDLLVQTDDDDEASQVDADEHGTQDLPVQTKRRAAELTETSDHGVPEPAPASD
ncbi:hypothetical protein ON010_g8662 [Phytophthora cinnamomi]|nr:hypothetical protein ON010_g8662 [Phytophthora cinnamomi]